MAVRCFLCLGTSLPSPLRAQPKRSEDPGAGGARAGPARAARRMPALRVAATAPRPTWPVPPLAACRLRHAAARLHPELALGVGPRYGFPVRRCPGHLHS